MFNRETHTLGSPKWSELGTDGKVFNVEVIGEPPERMWSLTQLIEVSIFFKTYTKAKTPWKRLGGRNKYCMKKEKAHRKGESGGKSERKDGLWNTIVYTHRYFCANICGLGFNNFYPGQKYSFGPVWSQIHFKLIALGNNLPRCLFFLTWTIKIMLWSAQQGFFFQFNKHDIRANAKNRKVCKILSLALKLFNQVRDPEMKRTIYSKMRI